MKMEDYLYKLVQARMIYLKDKLVWYKEKMPKLSGEAKEIAEADKWEFENAFVTMKWLLQLVDEGKVCISYEFRSHCNHDVLLKPLFKFAKRNQCMHEMPRCEDCYNLLGRWAAEELL